MIEFVKFLALPVLPLPSVAVLSLGMVLGIEESTLGSGMFVSGTGMVIVSVGILSVLVVEELVTDGVVAGVLLLQPQAHKDSANTAPKIIMAIFFISNLL